MQESLQPMQLGKSGRVRIGQQVLAIGNPFGFDHTLTTGMAPFPVAFALPVHAPAATGSAQSLCPVESSWAAFWEGAHGAIGRLLVTALASTTPLPQVAPPPFPLSAPRLFTLPLPSAHHLGYPLRVLFFNIDFATLAFCSLYRL